MADPKLDLTRPLAFYDERNLPEDQRRPVHVVGVTRAGYLSLESQYVTPAGKWWDGPLLYEQNGWPCAGHGGSRNRVVNVPKVDIGFYPMDAIGPIPNTRSLTVLSLIWSDYPGASYALEVKREDGIPVEVHLHARP